LRTFDEKRRAQEERTAATATGVTRGAQEA